MFAVGSVLPPLARLVPAGVMATMVDPVTMAATATDFLLTGGSHQSYQL